MRAARRMLRLDRAESLSYDVCDGRLHECARSCSIAERREEPARVRGVNVKATGCCRRDIITNTGQHEHRLDVGQLQLTRAVLFEHVESPDRDAIGLVALGFEER